MNSTTTRVPTASQDQAKHPALALHRRLLAAFDHIPHSLIAFIGRFSLAATFWQSGQTKVEGFAIDLVGGHFEWGIPHLAGSAIDLFRDEYALPVIAPQWAAYMAATAEHVFPLLLLVGLATRYSALALLGMTMVIQVFVYPSAYPTHGVWAAALLYLIARGPGTFALDHLFARRWGR